MASHRLISLAQTLFDQNRLFGMLGCQRGPDSGRIEHFAVERLAPFGVLFECAGLLGGALAMPAGLTFFYNKADWPEGAPPGGWLHEVAGLSPMKAMASQIGFWLLQAREGAGVGRLARGALWTLHKQGYQRALEFIIDSLASGVVTDWQTGRSVLLGLLKARRQVATDDQIFSRFASTIPSSPEEWQDLDVNFPSEIEPVRPDLFDDLDWLVESMSERIASCRASQGPDRWILGLAELGLLCRVLSATFRDLGLDEDLAYGSFAAQIEEIQADCGSYFLIYGFDRELADIDPLQLRWTAGSAMAAISAHHGEAWLEAILRERVLVPDALLELYRHHPNDLESVAPAAWELPSAPIRAALSRAILNRPFYSAAPIGIGMIPFSMEALRGESARSGVELDHVDLDDIAAILRRGLENDTPLPLPPEEIESIGRLAVPGDVVARLCSRTRKNKYELGLWIQDVYDSMCATAAADILHGLMQGNPGPLANLGEFVDVFPNFPHGYAERAIEFDLAGELDQAWKCISTAIALAPDEHLFWHSGAVILSKLGDEEGAAIAKGLAVFHQQRTEAG